MVLTNGFQSVAVNITPKDSLYIPASHWNNFTKIKPTKEARYLTVNDYMIVEILLWTKLDGWQQAPPSGGFYTPYKDRVYYWAELPNGVDFKVEVKP